MYKNLKTPLKATRNSEAGFTRHIAAPSLPQIQRAAILIDEVSQGK